MKKLLLILVAFSASDCFAASFIHPLEFDGSKKQQEAVTAYITAKVKQDYCDGIIDMCQATTLRMMETTNLNSFKKLTKATDKPILDRVIQDYCGALDMCSYNNLELMYNENLKANSKALAW
ncbi:conserved exported hypothetical protein [Vibrio chagasii]|nr:conserved exported hypothetical protein [Vibrio chagasii]